MSASSRPTSIDETLSNGMVKAMKKVALSEVKDDLSRYLRVPENEEVVITRHGKPAGVLVGFASEEQWFDYQLENDPRFLERIERARESLRKGKGVRLQDVAKAKPRRTKR
jgi:prevent-host-death family protein